MLEVGMKSTAQTKVTEENTAKATPAMLSLMEETCWKMIQPELGDGEGSVGTKVDISHDRASAIGHTITCEAVLTKIDRRRLVFEVTCFDGDNVIGKGTHERFIINNEKFMEKALG